MGILNVTPDSFSDGGRFSDMDSAVRHADEMVAAGADVIDVGGESTRPGSEGVSVDEEMSRVVPVIEKIKRNLDVHISVDTTKPAVAEGALAAGAGIINDVSMLRNGPELAQLAAANDAVLILMHSRKRPRDMQKEIHYNDVVSDVRDELLKAVSQALHQGVESEKIWLDPGIGFAKSPAQNLTLMAQLNVLTQCGYPVLVGPSRKSFIGVFAGGDPDHRLGGTVAAIAISIYNGAAAVRVHDIEVVKQAALISEKLREARGVH
jgi:dihydropteroate synthase